MIILSIIFALIVFAHYLILCILALFSLFSTKTEYREFCAENSKAVPSTIAVFLCAGGLIDWRFYLCKLNDRTFRHGFFVLQFCIMALNISLVVFAARLF